MEINLDIILQITLVISVIATLVMLVVLLIKQRETIKEIADIKVTLIEAFKQLDKPFADELGESRRNNRLLSQLLALKQAEMTGDFEIVEEPIVQNAPPPLKEPKFKHSAKKNAENLTPPPQSFPKIE
jgi:hypothetical protein